MKTIIHLLKQEYKKEQTAFLNELMSFETIEDIKSSWRMKQYITPAYVKKSLPLADMKSVIKARYTKLKEADLAKQLAEIEAISQAPDMTEAKVVIDWNKSRTWGMNAKGEAEVWDKINIL